MKTLLILVDGMRPDALADIPEAQAMLSKSSYSLHARTVFPSDVYKRQSLDYLMSETPFKPFTTDNYFERYDKSTIFVMKEQKIVVSKRLADALLKLPEQRRTVMLMYFFLGYTDAEIGNEYGWSRSTANYWKLSALKQLRKEMEKTEHEE